MKDKQIKTSGGFLGRENADRSIMANAWHNYKMTKNPLYLADAIGRIDFFGVPEAGREIAQIISASTINDKATENLNDSWAAKMADKMKAEAEYRELCLAELNQREQEADHELTKPEEFKTMEAFLYAGLLFLGMCNLDELPQTVAHSFRKRSLRRKQNLEKAGRKANQLKS